MTSILEFIPGPSLTSEPTYRLSARLKWADALKMHPLDLTDTLQMAGERTELGQSFRHTNPQA